MLKGVDIRQRFEFTSKHDDEDKKTTFVFRPLSGIDMLKTTSKGEEGLFEMLEMSIVEIKDFSIPDLSVKEILESLPTTVLSELLEKFNEVNNLTKEDAKN